MNLRTKILAIFVGSGLLLLLQTFITVYFVVQLHSAIEEVVDVAHKRHVIDTSVEELTKVKDILTLSQTDIGSPKLTHLIAADVEIIDSKVSHFLADAVVNEDPADLNAIVFNHAEFISAYNGWLKSFFNTTDSNILRQVFVDKLDDLNFSLKYFNNLLDARIDAAIVAEQKIHNIPLLVALGVAFIILITMTVLGWVLSNKINATVKFQQELSKNEAVNKARAEFLTNMSHEMRTPMHAILSFAELGKKNLETEDNAKLEQYLDRIKVSGTRLLELINNLLDLSKFEAGKNHLKVAACDFTALVKDVVASFEPLAAQKQQMINLNIAAATAVNCDVEKMREVVENLLGNAIKFAPCKATIDISLQNIEANRTTDKAAESAIELKIANSGSKIPNTELKSIFAKFTQSSVTKTAAGGTGLGLAITKQIVEMHKGKIYAQNLNGGGVEFVVVLPTNGLNPPGAPCAEVEMP